MTSIMTPADPEIVHCPSCEATLGRDVHELVAIRLKSGWYDGDLEYDLQLPFSIIVKCPNCQHVYRSDDAKTAAVQTVWPEHWELAATINDYQYAVDHRLAKSSDEELAFLIKVWQMAKRHTRPLFDKIAHLKKIDPIDTSLKKEIEGYISEIETHEKYLSEKIADLESTPALANEVLHVWLEWKKEHPDPLGRHRESWRRYSYYYMSKVNETSNAEPSAAEQIARLYVEKTLTSYMEDDASLDMKHLEDFLGLHDDSPLYTVENLDASDRKQALRNAITFLCPLPDIFPSQNVVELMGPPHEIFLEGENFLNLLRANESELLTAGEIAARVDDAESELLSFAFRETETVYLMRLAYLLVGRSNLLAADLFRQLGKFDQALNTLDAVDSKTLSQHGLEKYRLIRSEIEARSTAVYR